MTRRLNVQPLYPVVAMCRAAAVQEPIPEYHWHPDRRYRADYAWPLHKILVEVDGGLWIAGGHSRGRARYHDMAKDRAAVLLGWRVLRYGPAELRQIPIDVAQLIAAM